MVRLPRLLIASPASGHGKTTLTIGLMAVLRRRGLAVAPYKVGPDYIDPGYHGLATGRVSRNLDPVLCPPQLIAPLLAHGAASPMPADIAIIEGVMGFFDGRFGAHGVGSAAHVATLTDTPVILCVDASHTSRTIAATVAGIATFDPQVRIAGVVFNKVGSSRHRDEIADAMTHVDLPILGYLPRDANAQAPSRHLGLVPVEERPEAARQLDSFAEIVSAHVDIDRLLEIASVAPDLNADPWCPQVTAPSAARPIVAVAGGTAFTFRYAETTEILSAGGCEVVIVDPTRDERLPTGTCGIYLGGGFPEVHAREIAGNVAMRKSYRDAVLAGVPTVAECAGLLYLARDIDGEAMSGALPACSAMTATLTMGYRRAVARHDTLLARAGDEVVGHEFHRTALCFGSPLAPAWHLDVGRDDGASADPAATGHPTVHASYLHIHWAGYPRMAQRFIDAVHRYAKEHA